MDSVKYIGMDVHQETISIAVLNSCGKSWNALSKPKPAPSCAGLLYRWQSEALSTPTCRRPLSACPDVLLETANLRSILPVHTDP